MKAKNYLILGKLNYVIKMMQNFLMLPTPTNINWLWNFGSIIGMFLMIQIISGFFLTMHYNSSMFMAFNSIENIMLNINNGWFIRLIHMNGASFFFICIYIHIGRGLYYYSYKYYKVWNIGIIIFLLSMMTAFMGYVLPWGQMSFWGATVITNLLSAIPYLGQTMVYWLWGGFSVSSPTLGRFYSFHFIMPMVILMLVMVHLYFLHETGSNNPLGFSNKYMLNSFYPYFVFKDLLGFILILGFFILYCNMYPYMLGDPDNFIKANPMVTPIHIKPEWYFLFAYTILRTFTNKLGGVLALLMSILILFYLPYTLKFKLSSIHWYPLNQLYIYMLFLSYFMLTWLGSKPIEDPYFFLSNYFTLIYFSYFIYYWKINVFWDEILFYKK